jgi:hypothetical protein
MLSWSALHNVAHRKYLTANGRPRSFSQLVTHPKHVQDLSSTWMALSDFTFSKRALIVGSPKKHWLSLSPLANCRRRCITVYEQQNRQENAEKGHSTGVLPQEGTILFRSASKEANVGVPLQLAHPAESLKQKRKQRVCET